MTQAQTKGIHTSEFWVAQLTFSAAVLSGITSFLPREWAAGAALASQVAYIVSRGISKSGKLDVATLESIVVAMLNQFLATKKQDVAAVLQDVAATPPSPVTVNVGRVTTDATADQAVADSALSNASEPVDHFADNALNETPASDSVPASDASPTNRELSDEDIATLRAILASQRISAPSGTLSGSVAQ